MHGLSFTSATVRYRERVAQGQAAQKRVALELGAQSFPVGKITALMGTNGSGKSSLMRALIGSGPGRVEGLTLGGASASDLSRQDRARRLAYLSQDRTGPGLATVRDVIALGRFAHGDDGAARMSRIADRLDLGALMARRFGALSGGQQARVLLGRALVVDAPVLLADEPTASLDAAYGLRIMAELRAEARTGRTVIVSCHDLALAERFCDRALVLKDGKAIAHGPIRDALSDDVLAQAFGLRRGPDGFSPS